MSPTWPHSKILNMPPPLAELTVIIAVVDMGEQKGGSSYYIK